MAYVFSAVLADTLVGIFVRNSLINAVFPVYKLSMENSTETEEIIVNGSYA